jgi:hypothetical protein
MNSHAEALTEILSRFKVHDDDGCGRSQTGKASNANLKLKA